MTSFTPGPWRVGKKYPGDVVHTASSALIARSIIGSETEREANARLIAAAPELLEALKLCAAVCSGDTLYKNGLVRALEAARAAIAKATS
jgi:hypothetical protein